MPTSPIACHRRSTGGFRERKFTFLRELHRIRAARIATPGSAALVAYRGVSRSAIAEPQTTADWLDEKSSQSV
jgi:hypothetical protein